MKTIKNNLNIIPVVSYNNAEINKFIIYRENKGKSGIYRWTNLINGKSYVGSSICLRNRFGVYYSKTSIFTILKKGSSSIYTALLKYGCSNFKLDILEYCDIQIILEREQYYLDLLKPEYNLKKVASSRLSTKHFDITKNLIKITSLDPKHSEKKKKKIAGIS